MNASDGTIITPFGQEGKIDLRTGLGDAAQLQWVSAITPGIIYNDLLIMGSRVDHDLWDYDIPCPPNLVQVKKDGQLIDAVAQATKMGHLFVLDRLTGKPIFPVEEIPVPQSTIP